jgi:hypothetical protein
MLGRNTYSKEPGRLRWVWRSGRLIGSLPRVETGMDFTGFVKTNTAATWLYNFH